MDGGTARAFGALLTLAVTPAALGEAKTYTEAETQGSVARPGQMQVAQNIYPYPGGGYYYPPGYDPRQQRSDGWGWNGQGWGNRYNGGWNSGDGYAPQSGGAYQGGGGYPPQGGYYGPPQGGRGGRW